MSVKNIEKKALDWLQQLSKTLDADPDIIDSMPIEDVRSKLEDLGADNNAFHTRLSAMLGPTIKEQYQEKINAGLEKFNAIIESVQEWISLDQTIMVPTRSSTETTQPVSGTNKEKKRIYVLGHPAPVYPLAVSESIKYQTLILCRRQKKEFVILYSNWEVSQPFAISPEFVEEDIGSNHLYLFLSASPLNINEKEEDISPDRFEELSTHMEESDNCQIITLDVIVSSES